MGRYTISLRPRRGTVFTVLSPEFWPEPPPSPPSPFALKKCFYCPKTLADDSARRQHIQNTPNCIAAQRAALQRATDRRDAELRLAEAALHARKRRRVMIENVPNEDVASTHSSAPALAPIVPRSSGIGGTSASARVAPESSISGTTGASSIGHDDAVRRGPRRRGGLHAEGYPYPLAGAPTSKERAQPVDLERYMRSIGRMAIPEHFNRVDGDVRHDRRSKRPAPKE